jgi:hypothetical protein
MFILLLKWVHIYCNKTVLSHLNCVSVLHYCCYDLEAAFGKRPYETCLRIECGPHIQFMTCHTICILQVHIFCSSIILTYKAPDSPSINTVISHAQNVGQSVGHFFLSKLESHEKKTKISLNDSFYAVHLVISV